MYPLWVRYLNLSGFQFRFAEDKTDTPSLRVLRQPPVLTAVRCWVKNTPRHRL